MLGIGWDTGYTGFQKMRGELYRKMVEQALEFSDAVMLVYKFYEDMDPENAEKMRAMRAMLMPYLLHTRNDGECTSENPFFEWAGTRQVLVTLHPGKPQTYVDVYEISDLVRDVLLSANSFLDWWPCRNATDICFFKDEECWFGTTVHEYDLWIDDHEEIFADMLDAYGVEYERYPRRGPGYIEHYR